MHVHSEVPWGIFINDIVLADKTNGIFSKYKLSETYDLKSLKLDEQKRNYKMQL